MLELKDTIRDGHGAVSADAITVMLRDETSMARGSRVPCFGCASNQFDLLFDAEGRKINSDGKEKCISIDHKEGSN